MRPAPVRVMREQTNEVLEQGVATTKTSGNPRVTVVGIVGIKGDQIVWPVPAPRRQPRGCKRTGMLFIEAPKF